MGIQFVSYGIGEFNPQKITKITNHGSKPEGGLWASPVNAEWSWKDFTSAEQWHETSEENKFVFELEDNAKIYVICSQEDFNNIPLSFNSVIPSRDFVKLEKLGYDGVQLNYSEYLNNLREIDVFSRGEADIWDCDSICIFNKDIIIPVKNIVDGIDILKQQKARQIVENSFLPKDSSIQNQPILKR